MSVSPLQARIPRLLAALVSTMLILGAASATFAAYPANAKPDKRQGDECTPTSKSKACSTRPPAPRGVAPASPGTARLTTVRMPQPSGSDLSAYQGWLDRSKVPTPPGEIIYFNGFCPYAYPGAAPEEARAAGCVAGTNTIYLEQSPGYVSSDRMGARYEFMHEVGHVYENVLFAGHPEYRQRVRTILGDSRALCSWNGDSNGSGSRRSCDTPPNEYFADAYAFCSLYGLDRKIPEGDSGVYGYEPDGSASNGDRISVTLAAHHRLCKFMIQIAKRAGMDVSGLTPVAQRRADAQVKQLPRPVKPAPGKQLPGAGKPAPVKQLPGAGKPAPVKQLPPPVKPLSGQER